jgi:hypothetical protein
MAAEAVMELQTIRSRSLSPFDPGAVSVTMVHTGVRTNIIPDTATLGGTIRVFDARVVEQVEKRTREIVESIARGADGSAQVEFPDYFPAVVSDPALVKRMLPALERVAGPGNVTLWPAAMGVDDFRVFRPGSTRLFLFPWHAETGDDLGHQPRGQFSGRRFRDSNRNARDDRSLARISAHHVAVTQPVTARTHFPAAPGLPTKGETRFCRRHTPFKIEKRRSPNLSF